MTDVQGEPQSPEGDPRRLLFVSRQRLLAEALARLFVANDPGWSTEVLDIEGADLLARCRSARPTVVVVDVDTHVIPGMDLVGHLAEELPDTAVMVLGELDAASTAEAFSRGAKGVLTYSASPQQVHEGVEAAADGRSAVTPGALAGLLGAQRPAAGTVSEDHGAGALSARELDILRRLVAGASTRAIASELGISVQTVRKHTQNILNKLGVHSKLAAAAAAVRDGLV